MERTKRRGPSACFSSMIVAAIFLAAGARFQNRDALGAAFDSARRLYADVPVPPTEGFDLVARELAQRNPKLRNLDTRSVIDLQFVKELEQSGLLKSVKEN
jgi:hypothetical protein